MEIRILLKDICWEKLGWNHQSAVGWWTAALPLEPQLHGQTDPIWSHANTAKCLPWKWDLRNKLEHNHLFKLNSGIFLSILFFYKKPNVCSSPVSCYHIYRWISHNQPESAVHGSQTWVCIKMSDTTTSCSELLFQLKKADESLLKKHYTLECFR